MKTKGKLIVFEGISGTGKETQGKLLKNYLVEKGISTQIVFHPSAQLKEVLRDWRKNRNIDLTAEVYLLLADRYHSIQSLINPALARGEWVISLRSYISALVYQGKARSKQKWINSEFSRFEPKPDFLFWFKVKPMIALNRIVRRNKETGEPIGRFESIKLLEQKQNIYHQVLSNFKHITINANQKINLISQNILQTLKI